MFNSNSCVICRYSITDPICRSCYIKQTNALLIDLKINSITKNSIFRKIKSSFPIETLNKTQCILCRKENVTLCRYCFSVILIKTLKELSFPEDLIESFEYNQIDKDHEDYLERNLLENKNISF